LRSTKTDQAVAAYAQLKAAADALRRPWPRGVHFLK
jgi:hypothetical protein